MAQPSNIRIGGFETVRRLPNSGGQGIVYEARCVEPQFKNVAVGDTVVLKVMTVQDPEGDLLRRLKQRTDTLVAIKHTNIVRYYGSFAEDRDFNNIHVVVMDYLRGQTLRELLDQNPRGLDADVALRIIRDCLGALLFASEEHRIVHRDIKPGNIFLCDDGTTKLIDFELARQEGGSASVSSQGNLRGSFDYMAPDFIESDFHGDEQSDIFSLAICLHEALSGRTPYDRVSGSVQQASFFFINRWKSLDVAGAGSVIKISQTACKPVAHVQGVLKKALSPRREDRFASFKAFSEAFGPVKVRAISNGQDQYELLHVVGQGGFGEVFKARRASDSRLVAIKHLLKSEYAGRFIKEAKLIQSFSNSRLVRFIDFFSVEQVDGEQYFLVMDFLHGMPGSSLSDRLRGAKQGLPLEEVLLGFIRFAEGLSILHQSEVYHRDIKPSNLYFPQDRPGDACLMDMGVARDAKGSLTFGNVPGTLDFMPPEVAFGESRGDAGMDIYALGLCLYEALTAKPAFPRLPSGDAAVKAFLTRARDMQKPVFDHKAVTDDSRLHSLLVRMTEPDAAKRERDARFVADALLDLLPQVSVSVTDHAGYPPASAAAELEQPVLSAPESLPLTRPPQIEMPDTVAGQGSLPDGPSACPATKPFGGEAAPKAEDGLDGSSDSGFLVAVEEPVRAASTPPKTESEKDLGAKPDEQDEEGTEPKTAATRIATPEEIAKFGRAERVSPLQDQESPQQPETHFLSAEELLAPTPALVHAAGTLPSPEPVKPSEPEVSFAFEEPASEPASPPETHFLSAEELLAPTSARTRQPEEPEVSFAVAGPVPEPASLPEPEVVAGEEIPAPEPESAKPPEQPGVSFVIAAPLPEPEVIAGEEIPAPEPEPAKQPEEPDVSFTIAEPLPESASLPEPEVEAGEEIPAPEPEPAKQPEEPEVSFTIAEPVPEPASLPEPEVEAGEEIPAPEPEPAKQPEEPDVSFTIAEPLPEPASLPEPEVVAGEEISAPEPEPAKQPEEPEVSFTIAEPLPEPASLPESEVIADEEIPAPEPESAKPPEEPEVSFAIDEPLSEPTSAPETQFISATRMLSPEQPPADVTPPFSVPEPVTVMETPLPVLPQPVPVPHAVPALESVPAQKPVVTPPSPEKAAAPRPASKTAPENPRVLWKMAAALAILALGGLGWYYFYAKPPVKAQESSFPGGSTLPNNPGSNKHGIPATNQLEVVQPAPVPKEVEACLSNALTAFNNQDFKAGEKAYDEWKSRVKALVGVPDQAVNSNKLSEARANCVAKVSGEALGKAIEAYANKHDSEMGKSLATDWDQCLKDMGETAKSADRDRLSQSKDGCEKWLADERKRLAALETTKPCKVSVAPLAKGEPKVTVAWKRGQAEWTNIDPATGFEVTPGAIRIRFTRLDYNEILTNLTVEPLIGLVIPLPKPNEWGRDEAFLHRPGTLAVKGTGAPLPTRVTLKSKPGNRVVASDFLETNQPAGDYLLVCARDDYEAITIDVSIKPGESVMSDVSKMEWKPAPGLAALLQAQKDWDRGRVADAAKVFPLGWEPVGRAFATMKKQLRDGITTNLAGQAQDFVKAIAAWTVESNRWEYQVADPVKGKSRREAGEKLEPKPDKGNLLIPDWVVETFGAELRAGWRAEGPRLSAESIKEIRQNKEIHTTRYNSEEIFPDVGIAEMAKMVDSGYRPNKNDLRLVKYFLEKCTTSEKEIVADTRLNEDTRANTTKQLRAAEKAFETVKAALQ